MTELQHTSPSGKDGPQGMHLKTGSRLTTSHGEVLVDDEEVEDTSSGFLQYCWPAIFGIILAVIVQQIWDKVSSDYGQVGLRMAFPYVLLLGRPELGLGPELTKSLPQLFLYLQFPLEGFLTSFFISRGTKYGRAIVQVAFVHFIAAFVLWLLATPGASHGL